MRVTNNMLIQNINNNIHNNLRNMERSQEKLSTGKRLHNPSDDPSGVVEALGLRTQETEMGQFIDNVSATKDWLESTDSSLGEATDVLQRLRELTTYGASDSLHDEARKGLAEEVKELKDHLVQVANSDIGGKHIFGGHNTLEKPFERVENGEGLFDVEYRGNEGEMRTEINVGVDTVRNLTGTEVFGNPNVIGQDVLKEGIEGSFNDGDSAHINIGALQEIDHEDVTELEVVEIEETTVGDLGEDGIEANYALHDNDNGEVVALSEDGRSYQVLGENLELGNDNQLEHPDGDDLEEIDFATDEEGNVQTVDFRTRVTEGSVNVQALEGENSGPVVDGEGNEIEVDDDNLGAVNEDTDYIVNEYEDNDLTIDGVDVNYYWENDDDEVVAISEDGQSWYALDDSQDANDLDDTNNIEGQGNPEDQVVFEFDNPVTSGYVNISENEDDDTVSATAYNAVEFESPENLQEPDEENSMFHAIDKLYNALMDGDTEKLSNEVIEDIDNWLKQTQDNRSIVGPRINRMELTENRLKDIDHINKERLSEVEEADMAETIMNLKMEENVHRLALNAGARVIQPTLLDFLQ